MDPGSLASVANSATELRPLQTKEKKRRKDKNRIKNNAKMKKEKKTTKRKQNKSETGGPFMLKFKLPPLTIPAQLKAKKYKYDTKTNKVVDGSLLRVWVIV